MLSSALALARSSLFYDCRHFILLCAAMQVNECRVIMRARSSMRVVERQLHIAFTDCN